MKQLAGEIARDAQDAGQMTLGGFIDALKMANPSAMASLDIGGGLSKPLSYRGYYEQLAFGPTSAPVKISELLAWAEAANGDEMHGYKGGTYKMGRGTWIWVCEYGTTADARRITGVSAAGEGVIIHTIEGE